ncbi:hypothetical protein V1520DRAFT_348847 [Lipomyces starkeyi]|uniref:Uncharacterized protein n=1 Tax=Lipomyces starkeyi NRRL Y-11557 TaxID=675824 RepID=A0A1E3Q0F7_LIPST|nr:hypothetical protein LIPSTDRAFT_112884 [Lipomyces starkeyi NRRL Y-11557]
MTELIYVGTSFGRLALRSAGSGDLPSLLLIHGNSSSSRVFKLILESKITTTFRNPHLSLLFSDSQLESIIDINSDARRCTMDREALLIAARRDKPDRIHFIIFTSGTQDSRRAAPCE